MRTKETNEGDLRSNYRARALDFSEFSLFLVMWSLIADILISYLLFRRGGKSVGPLMIILFTALVLCVVLGAIIKDSDIV